MLDAVPLFRNLAMIAMDVYQCSVANIKLIQSNFPDACVLRSQAGS